MMSNDYNAFGLPRQHIGTTLSSAIDEASRPLKRQTGELAGEPPVNEKRARCAVCGKMIRTYAAYGIDLFVAHRAPDNVCNWCRGGDMIVGDGE